MEGTVRKLEGSALDLARLISEISVRIFGQIWNCDIEWDVRRAIDDGSHQIRGVPTKLDPAEGKLTSEETMRLQRLREALQGGWVLWEALDRSGAQGFVRDVSAEEWRDRVGTEEYRLSRYRFDEILAPIRKTFQKSGMSEEELGSLFKEAREEVYQEKKAKEQ